MDCVPFPVRSTGFDRNPVSVSVRRHLPEEDGTAGTILSWIVPGGLRLPASPPRSKSLILILLPSLVAHKYFLKAGEYVDEKKRRRLRLAGSHNVTSCHRRIELV